MSDRPDAEEYDEVDGLRAALSDHIAIIKKRDKRIEELETAMRAWVTEPERHAIERAEKAEAKCEGWEKAARECAGHCHNYCLSRVELEAERDEALVAYAEHDTLKAREARLEKALKDESQAAREVFEKLQRVSAERDGAESRYQLADTVVQSLSTENIALKARIEKLETGLLQARIPILAEDETFLKEFAQVHNERIKAALRKEGEENG